MTNEDVSFGQWIRKRRKALDLTQQELARRVGCSVSLIFKIESDERRPSRQITELLARHLEIHPGQQELFLKVARQEKSVEELEPASPLSVSEPAPTSHPRSTNLLLLLTSIIGREHELRASSSTQDTRNRTERLRLELEAQLTSQKIKAIRLRGQSITLEAILKEVWMK